MRTNFKRYFKALAATTAVMVVYFLTVVPWIEPGYQADYTLPEFTSMSGKQRWWQPIFQSSDWQNQQPTIVQNSRGVLLARSWEQVDQQTWKLQPLTIVLSQDDMQETAASRPDNSAEVWVISSQAGATIHFDSPLDLNSGRVPSIQRGYLEGDILIRRISLDSPTSPDLQLRTRNLTIDRREIWTHDEVVVDSSNLLIHGRMLRIHLLGDILSKQSIRIDEESTPRIGPIEEVELVHLDQLKMRLKPGGIWSKANPSMLRTGQPIAELPAHLEAQCGGRFSLNLSKQQASLGGGVVVKHHLQGLPPDEFQCQRIQVHFESDPQMPTTAKPQQQKLLSNLQLREIEAFGVDSLEDLVGEAWVELNAPTMDAVIRAKRLRYDFRKQRIELDGKLDHPAATASVAEMNFRGYHFRAPSIEYQAAPKDSANRPLHGGWMVAEGEGEMSAPAESPLGEVQIRWKEHFQWSPADDHQQRIEIVGKTLVESKSQGYLTTDRLQLWLGSPHSQPDSQEELGTPGFRPRRLVSLGPTQVIAAGTQLNVASMDLAFVYPQADTKPFSSELELQDSAGRSMFEFLKQPGSSNADGSVSAGWFGNNNASGSAAGKVDRTAQVAIDGQALVGSIASLRGQTWVDSMTLYGPLALKATSGSTPIEVHGETLVLAMSPGGEMDFEIEGKPAQVVVADGSMQGPRIRYNQREGQLWMDQPGECVLPTSTTGRLGQATSIQWEMPLRCSWQGRMLFNGQTVQFDGGVRLHGALNQAGRVWLVEGLCKSMDIQLAQAINLQRSDQSSQIDQIVLRNDVDLRVAQRDPSGQRISLQRLMVPAMTIYLPQEKVVAHGPGQGMAKFIGSHSLGSLAGNSSQASPGQLQCAQLRFRDSLVALLGRNEIVADGNVNIVSTPIANWDDTPDVFSIAKLAPGQMTIASDQIKLYDTTALNSTQSTRVGSSGALSDRLWEVQATGNVAFEGSTESGDYAGSGHQVSYVGAKNLLTLRGDGRTKAVLRRSPTTSSSASPSANPAANLPTVVQVPLATLNVKTMAVDVPEGGLDLQVDFQAQPGAPLPNGNNAAPPTGQAPPVQGPNPRDGIKNFLRGY